MVKANKAGVDLGRVDGIDAFNDYKRRAGLAGPGISVHYPRGFEGYIARRRIQSAALGAATKGFCELEEPVATDIGCRENNLAQGSSA